MSLDFPEEPARAEATIRAALDVGISLIDTAAVYTTADEQHHNEALIGRVLHQVPASQRPMLSTKGGHYRRGDSYGIDASPEALRADCEGSLRALRTERIDLYHLHWPDPNVPLAESLGVLDGLRQEGKIAQIGISNVDLGQLDEARRHVPLASVQNPLSVWRSTRLDVLHRCEQTAIAFLAYSPLAGGRHRGSGPAGVVTSALNSVASRRSVSPAQVALAWLLALSPAVIPLVGAGRPETARDAAAAMPLALTAGEFATVQEARRQPPTTQANT